jgi:hypothetical protein
MNLNYYVICRYRLRSAFWAAMYVYRTMNRYRRLCRAQVQCAWNILSDLLVFDVVERYDAKLVACGCLYLSDLHHTLSCFHEASTQSGSVNQFCDILPDSIHVSDWWSAQGVDTQLLNEIVRNMSVVCENYFAQGTNSTGSSTAVVDELSLNGSSVTSSSQNYST